MLLTTAGIRTPNDLAGVVYAIGLAVVPKGAKVFMGPSPL